MKIIAIVCGAAPAIQTPDDIALSRAHCTKSAVCCLK